MQGLAVRRDVRGGGVLRIRRPVRSADFLAAPLAAATVALFAMGRGAMDEEGRETRSPAMFVSWVTACAAGGAVGGLFSASFVGELILFGVVLGMVQWLVLQRFSSWAWLWPVASFFGWIAGQIADLSLTPNVWRAVYEATGRTAGSDLLGYTVFDPVIWAVLGLAQGAALLAIFGLRSTPLVAMWALASSLGGVFSAAGRQYACSTATPSQEMMSHRHSRCSKTIVTCAYGTTEISSGFQYVPA